MKVVILKSCRENDRATNTEKQVAKALKKLKIISKKCLTIYHNSDNIEMFARKSEPEL